jgi:hypothetical protein
MPFYYDTVRATTTNGSGSTETTHLRFVTAANKRMALIRGLYAAAVFGTAGGGKLRLKTCATAASGGTAQVPAARDPSQPACDLVAANDATTITAGGTPVVRLAVGFAQTGGNGGWVAPEPSAGITLLPNAGATGNAEIASIANAASVPIDITVEHSEGY